MKKLLFFLIPLIFTSCVELQDMTSTSPIITPVNQSVTQKINKKDPQQGSSSVSWELYPNPMEGIVNPFEKIIFKISPKSKNIKLSEASIDFGDGVKKTVKLKSNNHKNSITYAPVFLSHFYKKDGVYRPSAILKKSPTEENSKSEVKIRIAPKIKTEQELKDLAFEDGVNQIQSGIKKVLKKRKYSKPKFSLSVLNDANFEYRINSKEVKIIKKLTQSLVKRGYTILEKSPQALIRLAHESVVKENKTGQLSRNYSDYLEYGLRTQYAGSQTPFIYGIQIEGVDDRTEKIENTNTSNETSDSNSLIARSKRLIGKSSSKVQKDNSIKNKNHKITSTVRNRPLLYAKFSTANYLIVVDVIDDIKITKSKPIYYNIKYETQAIERTASVKLNVRILNRDGSIAWISDVYGEKTDRVIKEFLKK